MALAGGDLPAAEKLLQDQLAIAQQAPAAVPLAVLLGIVCEWQGDRERARTWYDRAAEVATSWDEHELCRFLLNRANARSLAEGDRHRLPAEQALSALARAVRTDDAAERERLVDRARRLSAWGLSETWFVLRPGFAAKPPAR